MNKIKYKIIHDTTYSFTSEVFFEPHFLRFKPKTTTFNNLESFKLNLTPLPVGVSEQIDPENNLVHFCWFEGLNKTFKIHAESIVTIRKYNPLNFILHPTGNFNLPINYSDELNNLLKQALTFEKIDKPLIEFGEKTLNDSKFDTVSFITNITNRIHKEFIVESREEGIPFEADKTFELKKGSCRDLVWMQIQLFRYMGLASRFVSGYYYIPLDDSEYELHAWLEVFLPGAGWIGLDPSHGIVVGNSHIPVACSTNFVNTMTVTGTIRGDADSKLSTKLSIDIL